MMRCYFPVLLVCGWQLAAAVLDLHTSPNEIQPCTDLQVTIACSFFDHNSTEYSRLVSMTISQLGQTSSAVDLASVDSFSGSQVHTRDVPGVSVTGNITSTATEGHLVLNYPVLHLGEGGHFVCESTSIDYFGHAHQETATATVEQITPDENPGNTISTIILSEFKRLLEKRDYLTPGYYSYDENEVAASGTHEGHTYLASKEALSYEIAWLKCAQKGGYLAEINTQEEYNFVTGFLKNATQDHLPHGLRYFITGGIVNGTTFHFRRHPEDPMYIVWAYYEPGYNDTPCLSLDKENFKFADTVCANTDVSSLCELPYSM
ncbi:uncharacterized protein LOC101854408 [Aplysia californica]|uniref:Uncharacterized protein LOC101854408 n=1 Tax=Aplysia californica TaxID=6500 RepID=A0ABM0JNF4_APLCA|nr:uncharacterized protein LOC101854408 [Aplysia californica]